jgi:hypothetical protein
VWWHGTLEPRHALLTMALLTMALLTMALLTTALLTMALLTMALLTTALLTMALLTMALLTTALLTMALLTMALLTMAPLTMAPLTMALHTMAPLTMAPLTMAPLPMALAPLPVALAPLTMALAPPTMAHLRVVPGVMRSRAVEAAVAPLLSGGPLEERLVGEARHVDVNDPKVRQREVLAPRVQAARRLVAHAELKDVARGPATRREQRLVGGAIVVLGEPVRALVAAPLVEQRW